MLYNFLIVRYRITEFSKNNTNSTNSKNVLPQ